jgi:hypothetical protein
MNERLKELAEQAGLQPYYEAQHKHIERFAELVRADEREACAALCDDWFASTAGRAIRERGEK